MCPYYSKEYQKCKIYNSTHRDGEYHTEAYCKECSYSYEKCPNYEQCKQSNGGVAPPPYNF